jgi:SAM-dependent methyltransferase
MPGPSLELDPDTSFGDEHGRVDDPPLRRLLRAAIPARRRPALVGAVRSLMNRGSSVSCPCCGGEFGQFIRHRGRPHAKCPRCGSLERHRMLWHFLEDRTDLFKGDRSLLHFAPEYSFLRRLKRTPGLRYVTADLDSPLADAHVDIMDLPFPDASFDAVMCSHVLEHVDDDRKALAEIRRVLRPGGWAILMTPIESGRATTLEDPDVVTPEERHRVYGQSDHARLYGRDFEGRVEAQGFTVRVEHHLDALEPQIVAREGLRREDDEAFGDEQIFLAVRP